MSEPTDVIPESDDHWPKLCPACTELRLTNPDGSPRRWDLRIEEGSISLTCLDDPNCDGPGGDWRELTYLAGRPLTATMHVIGGGDDWHLELKVIQPEPSEAAMWAGLRAVLAYEGYTAEEIAAAEATRHAPECEIDYNSLRWDCTDEMGEPRHPLVDRMDSLAEELQVALEAVRSVSEATP